MQVYSGAIDIQRHIREKLHPFVEPNDDGI